MQNLQQDTRILNSVNHKTYCKI